jgi:NitT/TauT family transport system substrate-binding protein
MNRRRGLLVLALAAVLCSTSVNAGTGGATTLQMAIGTGPASATVRVGVAQAGPPPQPLPQQTPVTIGIGATPTVAGATALLANYFGEFARENLKVTLISQPVANEIVLLQSGRIQMAAAGFAAGVFNAIHEGVDLHLVLEGATPAPTDQDGVWVRKGLVPKNGTFDACQLKHGHYNVAIGPDNNFGILPLALLVDKCPGTTLADVKSHMTFSPLAGPNVVAALDNGALDIAYLYDPLLGTPGLTEHATFEQKTPLSYDLYGWMMGSTLQTRPAVARAIMRAMVRTQDTYLTGNYTKNSTVLAALSKVLSEPEAELKSFPPSVFHDQLSAAGITQVQQAYVQFGGLLTFTRPISPSLFIDSSLVDEVEAQK